MPETSNPLAELRGAVADAARELAGGNGRRPDPSFDRPPRADFGDYSSNAAMLIAGSVGEPPRAVAERLGELVTKRLGDAVERVEVAGPGFLNLFVSDEWWRQALKSALAAGESFGTGVVERPERLLVEFVSANPTGPMHVGHARHAAYGDSLSRVLEFAGHTVEREFYVNDYGSQIERFAESIKARALGQEPPEEGYKGDYITDLAARIPNAAEMDLDALAQEGVRLMIEDMKTTLERFRVRFDRFFSEREELHGEQNAVQHALDLLEEQENIYPHEGAVWLRSTTFGDDKDRVLMRSNGDWTYFAADIAYHANKLERQYDRIVTVLGADHHGYVGRIKAAWQALGGDRDSIEIVIMQLVNLTEHGQRTQMSKRGGTIVTLDDLVEDIGVDAARYFLLERSHDTTLDLDLARAREQNADNPVYYVQYAHARIASILRKAGEERVQAALEADYSEQLHPSARALLKRLLDFPEEVEQAAERRAPHRMTAYVHEVAQQFSAFYRDVRVVGAEEEGGDEDFRIALSVFTQRVIAQSLDLLGVDAPDHM